MRWFSPAVGIHVLSTFGEVRLWQLWLDAQKMRFWHNILNLQWVFWDIATSEVKEHMQSIRPGKDRCFDKGMLQVFASSRWLWGVQAIDSIHMVVKEFTAGEILDLDPSKGEKQPHNHLRDVCLFVPGVRNGDHLGPKAEMAMCTAICRCREWMARVRTHPIIWKA